MDALEQYQATAINIEPLLKNFDIFEVTQYLATRDALLASEMVKVNHLKTKSKIINYLNRVLQTKPDRAMKILSTINDFSANTFAHSKQSFTQLRQLIKEREQKLVSKKQAGSASEKVNSQGCREPASSASSSSSNEDISHSSSQNVSYN